MSLLTIDRETIEKLLDNAIARQQISKGGPGSGPHPGERTCQVCGKAIGRSDNVLQLQHGRIAGLLPRFVATENHAPMYAHAEHFQATALPAGKD